MVVLFTVIECCFYPSSNVFFLFVCFFILVFYYIHDDVTPPWMTRKFTVTVYYLVLNNIQHYFPNTSYTCSLLSLSTILSIKVTKKLFLLKVQFCILFSLFFFFLPFISFQPVLQIMLIFSVCEAKTYF